MLREAGGWGAVREEGRGAGLGPLTGLVVVSLDRGPAARLQRALRPLLPLPPGGAGSLSPRRSPAQRGPMLPSNPAPAAASPQPRSPAVAGGASLLSGSSGQKGWRTQPPQDPRGETPACPACLASTHARPCAGWGHSWPRQAGSGHGGRSSRAGVGFTGSPPLSLAPGADCQGSPLPPPGPALAWACWAPLPMEAGCSVLCCYRVGPTSLGASRGHRVWLIP